MRMHPVFHSLLKPLILGFSALYLTSMCSADEGDFQPTSAFDSHSYLAYTEEKVGEPREISQTPIFQNAPFLKLRPGDKLIRAKKWNDRTKGSESHFDKNESYFLQTGGKYYLLQWSNAKDQALNLKSSYLSLLFDWEVNLKNALALQEIDDRRWENRIAPRSLGELKAALKEDFPETLRYTGEIAITKPHLQGTGEARRMVLQRLVFERFYDIIYLYQIEIGQNIYVWYRQPFIVGPRHVEHVEFDIGSLSPPSDTYRTDFDRSPEGKAIARIRAREEYERMTAFQNIVNRFLVKPRTDQSGFQY
jgi:hypothetical protein